MDIYCTFITLVPSFYIRTLGESSFERGYYWELHAKKRLEQCNPSFLSLKVVKVKGFKFQALEPEMIKFILEKAGFLEKLALVLARKNQPRVLSQAAQNFYGQILSWRASPNAKVEMFEYSKDKSSIHPTQM